MPDNRLRQIKLIIYRLKRDYGVPVTFYRQVSIENNITTGKITRLFTTYSVKKAPILPERTSRDFVYDLSFIAANKNFTYGGLFDPQERTMLVDFKDLPEGFIPNLDDYVIYNNERWLVKESAVTAELKAVFIRLKRTENLPDDLIVAQTRITESGEGRMTEEGAVRALN